MTIEKKKTRIVVKRFTQIIGEDYKKTYIFVAYFKSIQLLYIIAVSQRLCLWQMDFVSAFFNSNSIFDVFMEQPKEFKKERDNYVWKLQKILYSTIQNTHNWIENLDKTFKEHRYYKSCTNP